MTRLTKGLLALALAALLQLGWAQISSAEVVDRIVAEVNDEIITMSELEGASKSIEAQSGIKPTGKETKEVERNMLESLIDRKLAKAEAKRRGITVDDKEMAAALDNFKKKNNLPDDEAFNTGLEQGRPHPEGTQTKPGRPDNPGAPGHYSGGHQDHGQRCRGAPRLRGAFQSRRRHPVAPAGHAIDHFLQALRRLRRKN